MLKLYHHTKLTVWKDYQDFTPKDTVGGLWELLENNMEYEGNTIDLTDQGIMTYDPVLQTYCA